MKAVNGRVGRVKTECSEDDLPLDSDFAAVLRAWKDQCRNTPGDWVIPSYITERCFHLSPIQQDYIRPAGEKFGLKGIGWHAFRHTYRAWLDVVGAPVGVQQKLMRHAHISTTMDCYGNALMESKRDANSKVVRLRMRELLRDPQNEKGHQRRPFSNCWGRAQNLWALTGPQLLALSSRKLLILIGCGGRI